MRWAVYGAERGWQGGVYEYRNEGREIGERVINELVRCKDTIAF